MNKTLRKLIFLQVKDGCFLFLATKTHKKFPGSPFFDFQTVRILGTTVYSRKC